MRMSKTHKLVVTAVVTTIATATVLTFSRGESAPADHIAALPQATVDAPVVAARTPEPTKKPRAPKATATTSAPRPAVTQAPKPATKHTTKPSTSTKQPRTTQPTPSPSPSPSPTPRKKNLIEILLGL